MEIKKIKPPEPRIKFRGEEPKVEKVKTLTEKADFNFPKTLLGVVLIGAGIGCNYVGFLSFASDWLIGTGIGVAVAGLGLKINRAAKGRSAWQNEINLLKSIIKKGK
jgi:hypothetical protein